jgi:ABC-type transport system involved in multi-copper enzyme maturation permease subunit
MSPGGVSTVARQEFRLRIRAGRWRLLLGLFFLVLLGFTLLLRAGLTNLQEQELPFRGTVLYGGLMLFVLGLALLVVPALAAQSVNGDRERGTLAVLQVTRLTAADIALGKLVAAWGTSLVFLALTAPLVVYAMTQGGVPVGRLVVVTLVIVLLLGTVCAISLFLSAVLARTTTSGVLAYLSVFGLAVGTLIVFGLATAITAERYTETYDVTCPRLEDIPPEVPLEEREAIVRDCVPGTESYQAQRSRTDRTWFLLAPNPFVVLADAAPALPPPGGRTPGVDGRSPLTTAEPLDPLGQIGRQVRDLRRPPIPIGTAPFVEVGEVPPGGPLWPTGLAVNVLLGVGALLLTVRRLRTPSRTLPKGQRVA